MLTALWHTLVWFLSGEWMLSKKSRRPNGGSVVLARAFWSAGLVYAATLILRDVLDPTRGWAFSTHEARQRVFTTLPWFGAMFAGVYASLYTRFASQWTYLAGLYNLIKAAEVRGDGQQPQSRKALSLWKAGFIEDADELHLSRKPLFANVVVAWGRQEEVAAAFAAHAHGGNVRFEHIVAAANKSLVQHSRHLPVDERTAPSVLTAGDLEP
jgi:hypothetical protein